MDSDYIFIGPIHQLVTLASAAHAGAIKDAHLETITQAGLLVHHQKVIFAGKYHEVKKQAIELSAHIHELNQPFTCIPGFVDAHTHICFAGTRYLDYAMRNQGTSYLEIAEAGGGIWSTVTQSRAASVDELAALTLKRVQKHLQEGVTTIEVKSGYGLSVEQELKMLRAICLANSKTQATLIPTCLAAHTLPCDFEGSAAAYLHMLQEELFPKLLSEKLTNRVDAFVEKGAFSQTQIIPYFNAAKKANFAITVHADQFSSGGSTVAVNCGALSADHLEASTDDDLALLAKSKVTPVVLPGASIGLGCNFAPARKILDLGMPLAIASDWNPGSAPMGDLLTQAAIIGTFEKLSNAELLAALTYRAAFALGLNDRGKLAPGKLADLILFPVKDFREIFYYQGQLKPSYVFKNGQLINN